jgi:integrase
MSLNGLECGVVNGGRSEANPCERAPFCDTQHRRAAQAGYRPILLVGSERHLKNGTVWIADSKTVNGVAEVPLTDTAIESFRRQLAISGPGPFLFPTEENADGYQKTFKTVWHATLRRAGVPYFRIYDLRSTYATRLSAGGAVDEFVTQLHWQGDAKVFKKYSQMKRRQAF